ncbi:hypothetical protein FOCC_FOCC013894 [Frankliniella occidentalis]|nr:hypothetical protein FOCC_FOCC013894 [Frankliniella occidentalis]
MVYPLPVGVYYGKDKPANCNGFLNDFVQEISPLCANGLEHNGKIVKVRVWCAVCDAPAKSFVLNTKGHNSYYGCSKCTVKGNYTDHTMSFPCLDAPLRTDESFKAREQTHHHNGHTLLNDIPHFGPVSNVPLDYLHLTLLGVVRKTMYAWMSGPYKNRLSKRLVQEVSAILVLLSAWTPSEYIKYIKRFKATKYGQILLYTGIVAFSRSIREDLFDHFVCLHAAHYILADVELSKLYGSYAKELLKFYVKEFKRLYGSKFVSHNVHSLIHLSDDVEKFGPLDSLSAFKFENFLQILKKMMRKGQKPLQQLIRRLGEAEQVGHFRKKPEKKPAENDPKFSRPHSNGLLKSNLTGPQYTCCTLASGFTVNCASDANKCCILNDNSIILINNFAFSVSTQSMVAVGRKFSVTGNIYSKPFESSLIGLHYVEKLGKNLQCWAVANISKKCYRMPFKKGYAIVPMLMGE